VFGTALKSAASEFEICREGRQSGALSAARPSRSAELDQGYMAIVRYSASSANDSPALRAGIASSVYQTFRRPQRGPGRDGQGVRSPRN